MWHYNGYIWLFVLRENNTEDLYKSCPRQTLATHSLIVNLQKMSAVTCRYFNEKDLTLVTGVQGVLLLIT